MQVLNGQELSKQIKAEIKLDVDALVGKGQRPPHLAAILVGEDGASKTYVNNKIKSCIECGFQSTMIRKDASLSENELVEIIEELNNDITVDGFIIQLPLPKHINENKILLRIRPDKDVDGFTPHNIGLMTLGLDGFKPATPFGILKILERYKIETKGKRCIVVGRSNIVGKPIGIMLGQNNTVGNCTVTILNSYTPDIEKYTREADILIVAIGKPKMITADMVKDGAVVIDVGITRVKDDSEKGFHLEGDVDYKAVAEKCSYITPVPGGVGPMTVAMLLFNTLQSRKNKLA